MSTLTAVAKQGFKVKGLRFWMVGMVFLATLISYIDRLTISVLAPILKQDLQLSNTEYATISTWFLASYSISQSIFGRVYDRIGTKLGFSIAITIWSLAAGFHSLARGFLSFSICRFVLGVGEAGNWPGAFKTVAEWFPINQRALGMGIINCGAALGSVVAPPLVVWLQISYGWQPTFIITGSLGFFWLILWWLFYKTPDQHPLITEKEKELIQEGQKLSSDQVAGEGIMQPETSEKSVKWKDLLKIRQVWAIILARFFGDSIWWLYLIWLPSYLFDVRGFSLKEIGAFAWVPFLAADMGSLSGGWISGFLIQKGWSVNKARKTAILFATCFLPFGILGAYATEPATALVFISMVLFGFQFWVNNVQTLPGDFFGNRLVASVSGLGGTGAGIGAMIFTLSTGWVIDHFSYTPILIVAGVLGPVATLILFLLSGKIRRIVN